MNFSGQGVFSASSQACCSSQKPGNLCIRELEKARRLDHFDALRQRTAALRRLGNTPLHRRLQSGGARLEPLGG